MTSMQEAYYEAYRHTMSSQVVTDDGWALVRALVDRGRVRKPELARALGWSERRVRKAAELLRRTGIGVLASSGNGAGYWLSTDSAEIETYIAHEITSRIASFEEQRASLRAATTEAKRRMSGEAQKPLL